MKPTRMLLALGVGLILFLAAAMTEEWPTFFPSLVQEPPAPAYPREEAAIRTLLEQFNRRWSQRQTETGWMLPDDFVKEEAKEQVVAEIRQQLKPCTLAAQEVAAVTVVDQGTGAEARTVEQWQCPSAAARRDYTYQLHKYDFGWRIVRIYPGPDRPAGAGEAPAPPEATP